MESEPREAVVTEQVTGLLEHHKPGSELAGLEVIPPAEIPPAEIPPAEIPLVAVVEEPVVVEAPAEVTEQVPVSEGEPAAPAPAVTVSPSSYSSNGYNGNGYISDSGSIVSANGSGSTMNGAGNGSMISGFTGNGFHGKENASSFIRRRLLPALPKGRKPSFNVQCLQPQSSMDDVPMPGYHGNIGPSRAHIQRSQFGADRRHVLCLLGEHATAGPPHHPGMIAPSGRRGKLIYTPMLRMDQASGRTQPMWSDGSASLPAASRAAAGWYPGQTRTLGSARMPPVSHSYLEKGSADSLVESILISEGLGVYARDPKFVSFAKREIAEACHLSMDDMESAASDLIARGASQSISRFEDELADEMNCVISY
ncbi:hypothetical protein F7725_001252 [Dissostichus mawsoni]|uniref:Voltage-gated calcium channel subunit alpha C-terminal domain-containing protein n=1 Tax=Dissostichus mawsoni TaxID=36200 RepID=A0A7J5ZJX3_DISMA|nr:hypothetical protein F7725_001252 [Dissostichus mawsoni]